MFDDTNFFLRRRFHSVFLYSINRCLKRNCFSIDLLIAHLFYFCLFLSNRVTFLCSLSFSFKHRFLFIISLIFPPLYCTHFALSLDLRLFIHLFHPSFQLCPQCLFSLFFIISFFFFPSFLFILSYFAFLSLPTIFL